MSRLKIRTHLALRPCADLNRNGGGAVTYDRRRVDCPECQIGARGVELLLEALALAVGVALIHLLLIL